MAHTQPAARNRTCDQVIFRSLLLLIAGSIAIALFTVLMGLLFGRTWFCRIPAKNFILDSWTESAGVVCIAAVHWCTHTGAANLAGTLRIMGVHDQTALPGICVRRCGFVGLLSLVYCSVQ